VEDASTPSDARLDARTDASSDAIAPMPGTDTKVTVFSGTYIYHAANNMAEDDPHQMAEASVKFPDMPLTYQSITLNLALRCPPSAMSGCDHWDRLAYIGVVHGSGAQATVTEVLRFITPYGVGANWSLDVTSLRPLLSGAQTLRVYIDTHVYAGSQDGGGWLVDASFDFVGGTPARVPIAVIPIWDEMLFDFGDPKVPIATSVAPQTITWPAGASSAELRSFITGHGQGNLQNCSEFCQQTHTFSVGAQSIQKSVWRTDCATSTVPNQLGNVTPSRAGWCPGATVVPWVQAVTSVVPGQPVTVSYGVGNYVNTCRPDSPVCAGCAFSPNCAYNGMDHTKPIYALSSALVVYGR
jgi:hypothetical protein